jgi:hypothetical protein
MESNEADPSAMSRTLFANQVTIHKIYGRVLAFYYSELCNTTQCETVTLEMNSQICIAFYFKFSAL